MAIVTLINGKSKMNNGNRDTHNGKSTIEDSILAFSDFVILQIGDFATDILILIRSFYSLTSNFRSSSKVETRLFTTNIYCFLGGRLVKSDETWMFRRTLIC